MSEHIDGAGSRTSGVSGVPSLTLNNRKATPINGAQGVLQADRFDLTGPLPTGTTVLEASAGTGKTYTIATLAARYVAEGYATLPELMLVTFGREATRELRERVRERLRDVAAGLGAPATDPPDPPDPVVASLRNADPVEVARRRVRLDHALAHFDAATIATTHQFCQRMLDGLGMVGDTDPEATFTEDVDDLVTEVVDDFYVRKYAAPGATAPPITRDEALALGRRAVNDPGARLEPARSEGVAGVRAAFAGAVRTELDRRKRTRRLFTYDDMLTRLRDVLAGELGPVACARLRARFRVVLVDEFQDTDPIQWEILRRAFHGHAALTFIGDPKQAIYAFRGADVVSYLDAVAAAGTKATLTTNRRSDAALVEALDVVLGRAALGHHEIVVGEVDAHHRERRLRGAGAPLRLRVVPRTGLRATERGMPRVDAARLRVADDLAADVAELLDAGASWNGRPLTAGDVAVLVRTNQQGALVHGALTAAGVPAVLTGTQSVFATPSAAEWLTLLEAIEQPARATRVRAAALTGFVGCRAAELDGGATGGDGLLDELGSLLRRWGAVLRDRGVAALLEILVRHQDLPARLLATTDGERRLTDLRHVGQALHAAATTDHLGPAALVEWLRRRIAEAGTETDPERSRRLESDTDAVQILTVHRCKGLEFPVVAVPFGWDRHLRDPDIASHHDAEGHRVLAVGGESDPDWKAHVDAHHDEESGEDLRLLYVALTRAQGQVVAWWAPSTTTRHAPLHRLLFGRGFPGTVPAPSARVPDDTAAREHLARFASPVLAVEDVVPRSVRHHPRPAEHEPLVAARFDRPLDLAWRRTSYSALTAGVGHGAPSEPEAAVLDDEPALGPALDRAPAPTDPALERPSPMADLPLGTGFGLLVHAVLEAADLAAGPPELVARTEEALRHRPAAGVDAGILAAALAPVVATPLIPESDGTAWSLRDVALTDRLSELDFELPLAGGDTPGADVRLGAVGDLLRRHLPADDPLRTYPDVLAPLAEAPLRGYLTGSVDAVLRTPDGRYVVVDYKTNWLGPVGPAGREPLTVGHYRPTALARAMIEAHYPLQALLYAVALHRFLRWRLRGYDPERHLGGALYLFLRGMAGPETPVVDGGRCGVFAWHPPAGLVVELSAVLDGRREAA